MDSGTHAVTRRGFLKASAVGVAGLAGGGAIVSAAELLAPATTASAAGILGRLRKQGYVRAGFANESPFSFATTNGDLSGESIVVLQTIAKDLKIGDVEGVLTEFGSLIPGLLAKRFDVIAAGMYINPERCQQIIFSDPDYGLGEAMLVKKGNPFHLHSYKDVAAHPKVKFGIVAGGAETGYAKASGIPDSQMTTFPDGPSALAGLQAGRIDAFTLSTLSCRSLYQKAHGAGIEIAHPWTDPIINGRSVKGYGAWGFRRNEGDFRNAFNDRLVAMKKDGALLKLIKPFGFQKSDIAGVHITAAKLCKG